MGHVCLLQLPVVDLVPLQLPDHQLGKVVEHLAALSIHGVGLRVTDAPAADVLGQTQEARLCRPGWCAGEIHVPQAA